MMVRVKHVSWALSVAISAVVWAIAAGSQLAQAATQQAKEEMREKASPSDRSELEASASDTLKALEILKASSNRLAAARSMNFTVVVSYESPSRYGAPLVYTTTSEVTVQRPDKLRVVTSGDGPASEFYYDGKTMMAYAPAENLVAVADAPPTIDGALKAAYDTAAIYFPFTDVVVADPYQDIADHLELAFYIGQSHVVGGTTTDMVAYASDGVFVQAWIGAEDKLPRMTRAVYQNDPLQLRHQAEFSNWQLNGTVPPNAFASSSAKAATPIPFDRPDAKFLPDAAPAAQGEPSKIQ